MTSYVALATSCQVRLVEAFRRCRGTAGGLRCFCTKRPLEPRVRARDPPPVWALLTGSKKSRNEVSMTYATYGNIACYRSVTVYVTAYLSVMYKESNCFFER